MWTDYLESSRLVGLSALDPKLVTEMCILYYSPSSRHVSDSFSFFPRWQHCTTTRCMQWARVDGGWSHTAVSLYVCRTQTCCTVSIRKCRLNWNWNTTRRGLPVREPPNWSNEPQTCTPAPRAKSTDSRVRTSHREWCCGDPILREVMISFPRSSTQHPSFCFFPVILWLLTALNVVCTCAVEYNMKLQLNNWKQSSLSLNSLIIWKSN